MRIISGTLKSTPLYWLPVLSNIIPPSIRRQNNLLREFKKISSNQSLPVHEVIMPVHRRLKSRSPPLVTAKRLLEEAYDGIAAWKRGWIDSALTAWHPLLDPNSPPPGFQLPRKLWVTLNRVRTGHGRCGANLTKWGFSTNPACDCGASLQTTEHITFDCPSRAFGGTREDFLRATPEAVLWLEQLDVRL
ncbi:hypothetical protein R5R35_008679 [Gryllus longicercus]|uniref:Reverse transcriptase n=2 Tax=Gryllus longicercus TaxID=2509291 RepID=A0AAN9V375_9ORTH